MQRSPSVVTVNAGGRQKFQLTVRHIAGVVESFYRRAGVVPIFVKIASAHYDLVFFCRRRESALCLNDGDQDDREKVKHKPLMLQKEAHIGDWLTPAQRMREKLV